jgi:adenine phosphoribosyltransferase
VDLKHYIRDVPDFPVPGVLFRDITPLLRDATAFAHALELMATHLRAVAPDAIAGIESRGFLFGAPLASMLGLPFVPIRKPGKLPAARMTIEYTLEYGNNQLDIHADALSRGQRAVIVDDLLATGGTARATSELVKRLGGEVHALAFLIELVALNGRNRLEGDQVHAVLQY